MGDKQVGINNAKYIHIIQVFFNRPIDHQSTSNDRLKPVMTTGLVNMHIDRSIANLGLQSLKLYIFVCPRKPFRQLNDLAEDLY